MDFSGLAALHADGHDVTAWSQFAQKCREALYDRHGVPADVSHLVHYTTLGTLTSMLGVVATADEKYRLATRVPEGLAEQRGGSVGYLRTIRPPFPPMTPNEGGVSSSTRRTPRAPFDVSTTRFGAYLGTGLRRLRTRRH